MQPGQRKLVENALRDFRLAGVALPDDRKDRFRAAMERLAVAQSKFDENVLDATNAWSRHVTDAAELEGLPDAVTDRARAAAEAASQPGWLFSLDAPNYQAVLTHADNEPLRREFYTAWVTRASDAGPHAGQWDNSALMAEILQLRHEAAQLVGFANFAEYSLATKMAHETGEVLDFLRRLAQVSRPAAQREFDELQAFAGRALNAWDVAFHAERLKRERLQVSEEELRPYFPLTRVLAGLFAVASRLYGIRIVTRNDVETYHPDVRYFDILERDGTPRGGFFLDLYARPKKRGGAWMDECVGRMRLGPAAALPVAYLVCNFTPPAGAKPVAAHALRGADAVPRIRPRPASHADARRLPERERHQRRAVGRGRTAQPVHGELRVARGSAAADLGARRHRRAAAGRDPAQAAGDPHVPGGHADGAAARVRAVRFPAARRVRARAAARASPRRWPRCATRWP